MYAYNIYIYTLAELPGFAWEVFQYFIQKK